MVGGLLSGDDTIKGYRHAVLSRHLDSLATVVQRRRQYSREGRRDRAAEYARRADFYAADLEAILQRVTISPRLADCVRAMARARNMD
jgi:hypothetical protein